MIADSIQEMPSKTGLQGKVIRFSTICTLGTFKVYQRESI